LGKKRKNKNFGGLGPFHFRMLIGTDGRTDGRTDWRRVYKTLQPVIITSIHWRNRQVATLCVLQVYFWSTHPPCY
jgi:hypothetical protein